MKKILFLLPLLMLGAFCSAGPWDAPAAVTQVTASAVTGTAMWGTSTSVDPWVNGTLFPYSLTKTSSGKWQSIYPTRLIITNPSGYTLSVWYQSNTPSASVYGVLVPAGSSYIWPSPMYWPARVYASTTNTAAVSYGVSLWR